MDQTLNDIHALLKKHLEYNTAPDAAAHKRGPLVEQGKRIAKEDESKTPATLLGELHTEANDDQTRSKAMTVAITTAKFASLLSVLAAQADTQSQRVIRLTKWIIGLTIVLGVLTVALVVATFVLLRVASHTDDRIRQIHEIAEAQRNRTLNETSAPRRSSP